MIKKIVKIIVAIFILIAILFSFLLSDYNPMFKNEEFIYLTNSLNEAKKENLKSFANIYNKIYPEDKREKRCKCEVATNYIGPYRHGFSLTKKIYLLKIEKEFTHDDCLNFELLNADYLYENTGIKDASKYYFGKNINNLNEEEKIFLLVMLENPSLNNPKRRMERVMNKVRIYQRILHKKNGS